MTPSVFPAPLRILLGLAAFVVIVAGMRASAEILVPFLLAAFIAIIAAPPMFWLKHRGVPTWLAILIVISTVLGFAVLVGALIGTSVKDFTEQLPIYQEKLKQQMAGLLVWLAHHGIYLPDQKFLEYIDPGKAMQLASGILKELGGALSNAFLIFLTVVFMLAEASGFPRKLRAMLGPRYSLIDFEKFLATVETYVEIKTVTSLASGVLVAAALWMLGVDYALLWGLLTFLLNYIPTIGSIVSAVPPVLLALVQLGMGAAILAAVIQIIINIVISNVIEPRYMGRGVGLSTLVVFLSLLFWSWVLGPVGMLLSVPLTMTAKIALDSRADTRWLAILLGPDDLQNELAPVKNKPTKRK
jgi:AI-2 transport protein TqsA